MLPWYDRTGRFSALKLLVLLGILAPALWLAGEAALGGLGSRPVTQAIHQSGLWAVRLLAMTLAVTPLRLASRWSKLVSVRRMLGVGVAAYALLHLALYILDQKFDLLHVAAEIVLRIYLLIGFIALCGLCVLAATSTDAMIGRLGSQRWNRLHKIVYAITALATVHFFLQSKLDVTEPVIMAGIFALLVLHRLVQRVAGDLGWFSLAIYAVALAAATAIGEAGWFAFSTGAPLMRVLEADFDFSYTIRPAWYVLGAGAVLVLARLARPLIVGNRGPARIKSQRPQRVASVEEA